MSAPELTIVAPTFNERGNVAELIARLDRALAGERWEIVFVDDDSSDGTIDALREIARADARVRAIHRIGRRGLASAVVEGALSSSAPFIAVMDADLQHDEALLPRMLARLRAGEADVAVGSRYVEGGDVGAWSAKRVGMSRLASAAARLVTPTPLTDPMSGFFMLTRAAFDSVARGLSSQGFKILLDILATARGRLRVVELPYTFRSRAAGESKLDSAVVFDYFALLADKSIGRVVPVRFVLFALVGGVGVIVHMGVLAACLNTFGMSFIAAQAAATVAAMTFNFALNNQLTYRDRRLRGWRLLTGLFSFYLVCSVGAVANVGIANYLFGGLSQAWWVAGLAGVVVGAVWNFAASAVFTWRVR
ncbi:MAG: glycosyltransferase family 2 protein [Hyphomonadaceae bacterium]